MKSKVLNFIIGKTQDTKIEPVKRLDPGYFTDIHCHCLPYLDDGPSTITDSLLLCQALVMDCFSTVVATPHQLGRFEGRNQAEKIRESVTELNKSLTDKKIPLKIVPGAEIRIDERICKLIENDEVMTIADGNKYILIEMPYKTFINIEPLLKNLNSMGIKSIISHVEKIEPLVAQPNILYKWLKHSVYLQVTASSLLGDFGLKAQKASWDFLNSGLVSFVATDSHDTNSRRPRMREAFNTICRKLGENIAKSVCIENPARAVNGQHIITDLLHNRQEASL